MPELVSGTDSGRLARLFRYLCPIMLAMLVLGTPCSHVSASEGGGSSFIPGSHGDFAMCVLPPGLHVKDSIVYTEGSLEGYPSGTVPGAIPVPGVGLVPVNFPVESKLKTQTWFDLLQITYTTESRILGARYMANVNIPFILSQKLTTRTNLPLSLRQTLADELQTPASVLFPTRDDESTTSGIGDIQVVPLGLIWDMGDLHILAAQNFVLKTGRYESGKANNTGRDYLSYNELLGVTWLDEQHGHELSALAGYMINTRNKKTEYKTGNEFHLEATLAQHLSREFAIGAVGYYYKQLKDDDSPELDSVNQADEFWNAADPSLRISAPGGYKSEGYAAGPAMMYSPKIGDTEVHFIAKWLYEFSGENRLEGNWVWLSACVKF